MDPLISVVMPARNCEDFIEESLGCILNQSFKNFEVLLFNDRSTDSTLEKLKSFDDPRIILEDNKETDNYVDLINLGIRRSRGKYIANMDADDLCGLTRFEKQVAFLESHSDVDVLGTWGKYIGARSGAIELPVEDRFIKLRLLIASPMIHASTMIRRSLFVENEVEYDRQFVVGNDYRLWTQLVGIARFHNLNESLFDYRIHETNLTVMSGEGQVEKKTQEIRQGLFEQISPDFPKEYLARLIQLLDGEFSRLHWEDIKNICEFLQVHGVKHMETELFFEFLAKKIRKYAHENTGLGFQNYRSFKALKVDQKPMKLSRHFALFIRSALGIGRRKK